MPDPIRALVLAEKMFLALFLAFKVFFMQTKMIQGQFRLAEYDTGVILDIGHVWKALDARKNNFLGKNAEIALGDKFDVRNFHDAVLWNGSVPLDILEKNILQWQSNQ